MRRLFPTRRPIRTCLLWLVLAVVSVHMSDRVCGQLDLRSRPITVANCRLKAVNEVQLACQRGGILAEIAPAGTYVKAGAVVARLRDSLARATLAIADKEASNDIEVRFARKAAQLAQLKYERTLEANRTLNGTVSELELRELRLAAEKALLQLEQAEHHFQVAGLRRDEQRETLQTYYLTTPTDAFVRFVHKKPGEVVREGEVILELVNADRIRVEGFIELSDAHRVSAGDPVEVGLAGDNVGHAERGRAFSGRIGFVDLKVEPVSRRVLVWADVQNVDRWLRDGLTATMTINPNPSADSAARP